MAWQNRRCAREKAPQPPSSSSLYLATTAAATVPPSLIVDQNFPKHPLALCVSLSSAYISLGSCPGPALSSSSPTRRRHTHSLIPSSPWPGLSSLSSFLSLSLVPKSQQQQQQIQYILGSIASHISHPKPSNRRRPSNHTGKEERERGRVGERRKMREIVCY